MTSSAGAGTLLDDISVVDFSMYVPGPLSALHLAWMGASVVHVQRPPSGDPLRAVPPFAHELGMSYASASLERGKRIVMLDLADAQDHMQARELCAGADVVIEGFRPGVAARHGLDADTLRTAHPRLIHCSISCYGQSGPWSPIAGHDANAEAIAGLLWRTGTADRPMLPPVPIADIASGMLATSAICAALVRRERTGYGATIDVSMMEAALALQAHTLAAAADPLECREAGLLTGGLACYNTYQCADGAWYAVAAMEPHFFARLLSTLELPESHASLHYDPAAQSALRSDLAAAFMNRSADAWDLAFADVDACATRIVETRLVHKMEQVRARKAVVAMGAGFAPASPYVIDGVRTSVDA